MIQWRRVAIRWIGALAVVAALAACGDGSDGKNATTTTSPLPAQRDPDQRYRATGLVLQTESRKPQLCLGAVNDSYPPQCGGVDIVGWDWDALPEKETASGTTWGQATVVGTFDGTTFTLTESPRPPVEGPPDRSMDFSPACPDPEGDPGADRNAFRPPEHPDLVTVWWSEEQQTFNVLVRPGAADAIRTQIRANYRGLLCVVERDLPSGATLRALQDRIADEAEGSPLWGLLGVFADERRGVVMVECVLSDDVSKAWAAERWGDNVELLGHLQPVDGAGSGD